MKEEMPVKSIYAPYKKKDSKSMFPIDTRYLRIK